MLNLRRVLLSGFFLSGFAALIYEVVWTQLLTLLFGSSAYSFSIMLAAFFLGLGIGGYVAGKNIDKIKDAIKIFSYLEMGIGLSGLIILLFYEKIGETLYFLYRISGSFYLFMVSVFLLSFLFMAVPAALMGATLPVVSKIYSNNKETVGRNIGEIFSSNTFGAIFGSSVAGFVLIPAIGLVRTTVVAALINITVAFIMYCFSKGRGKNKFYTVFVITLLLALYFSAFTLQPLITGVYRITHDPDGEFEKHYGKPKVIYYGSNAYGTVVVADEGKYRSLWINNKVDASTTELDMTTQLLLGYLPMFANPEARKVLNIGLGGGFTLGAIEAFDNPKIDVIELNPLVKEATGKYFREFNGNALENDRANIIIADARNYLLTSNEKYDVIISEPSNLWVSGESNLFTREFYLKVKDHLNEKGVFSQWIPMYDFSEKDMKIFLNTIRSVFPHATLWISGNDGILIASQNTVSLDYKYIIKMLNQNQRIRNDLNFIAGNIGDISVETSEINLPDALIKSYYLSDDDIRAYSENSPFHTDDYPVLEFDTAKNFLFLKEKSGSIESIEKYLNNGKDDSEYFAPVLNEEHYEGDLLYLDFMGLKIKTDNLRKFSSGYRIHRFNSINNNIRYDKFISFIDNQSSYNIIGKQSDLKTFEGDSDDVGFVKNIQRRSETRNILQRRYNSQNITEFKKDRHDAYMVIFQKDQGVQGTIAWYCEINNLIYLVDINLYNESDFQKINDVIKCIHD